MKLLNRFPDELVAPGPEKDEGRRIGFETKPLVIKDQNGVEGTIEDRLEFPLGGVKDTCSLVLFAACQEKEVNLKSDSNTKGRQDYREQDEEEMTTIEPRSERGQKQEGYSKENQQETGSQPMSAGIWRTN